MITKKIESQKKFKMQKQIESEESGISDEKFINLFGV